MANPRIINGKEIGFVHLFKQPQHGKSPIDSQGGRMKRNLRAHETANMALKSHEIQNFLLGMASHGKFDKEGLVYKVNFYEEQIEAFSGELMYAHDVFKKMYTKNVHYEGVKYGCGIRTIRSVKVKPTKNSAGADAYAFYFTHNVCLDLCDKCLRSDDEFCAKSIPHSVTIEKDKFVLLTKTVKKAVENLKPGQKRKSIQKND